MKQPSTKILFFTCALIVVAIVIATEISSQYTLPNRIRADGASVLVLPKGNVGDEICCTQGVYGHPNAQCYFGQSINSCALIDGAVQTCLPFETVQDPPVGVIINYTAANTTTHQGFIRNLTSVVAASNISDNVYNATSYDCDSFADDLEQHLQNAGYNATFTIYYKYNNTNSSHILTAHALTDVHHPDGTIIFVEPQTGRVVDMDLDGDGMVEVNDRPQPYPHGYHPTDDEGKIIIYDSMADAIAAGASID